MTRKVAEIAAELGVTEDKVREIIASLGLRVGRTASKINDEVARMTVAKAKGEDPAAAAPATRGRSRRPARGGSAAAATAVPETEEGEEEEIEVKKVPLPTEGLAVKDLAERLHLKATAIITALMQNGVFATINDTIDYDTAAVIAGELGFEAEPEAERETGLLETSQLRDLLALETEENLQPRPPVISVIGHVDHGKTSLLDAIRGTSVQTGEAGGITQRIGAYQVIKNNKPITFLDTPGHEAFSAMRARGVKSTDIAILVVAADDGVKPQTVEAIAHAREAKVPLVVALNKMDKPDSNPQRVKSQLAEHGVYVEGYGGNTVVAEVSAKSGKGIQELLDMVLLVADIENLRANASRAGVASVIEAHLDPSLGPVASVLVHTGTLRMRDPIAVGPAYGRVKLMLNHLGERVETAPPSTPVLLAGLSQVPRAGDILQVAASEQESRALAEAATLTIGGSDRSRMSVDDHSETPAGMRDYRLVIKADLRGSLDAIKSALERLTSDAVQLKLLHLAAGDVSDSDVLLAAASKADLYAFNVRVPAAMVRRAEAEGIKLKSFNVIYKLVEEVEAHLNTLIEPERIETPIGAVRVLKVFFRSKEEMVVGGDVVRGVVQPKMHVRIYRNENLVGEADITEVRQGPESVNEMKQGTQCGMRIVGTNAIKEGDTLEVSMIELKQRTVGRAAA